MVLPAHITKLLHKIAENEKFTDYTFETKAGSNHGDNYLGVMIAVTISGIRCQNEKTEADKMHLICKMPPSNSSRRKSFKSDLVFARELFVYSKLLPAFVRFQKEKGLSDAESFISFPKVYASEFDDENNTYALIMEDLRAKNYRMWPREQVIRLDHELAVMRELAKFHACSLAMKDQRPDEFEEFKQLEDPFCEIAIKGKLKSMLSRTIERAAKAMKDPLHKKILENFQNTHVDMLKRCFAKEACDRFGVIGHGDCWNNNFLFRYDEQQNDHLESICLLDWQITRYCSPVLDLLYNIFSATDQKFREENYEKLLKTYHSTLSDTVRKLGSDPQKLFSYDDLQSELRDLGEFALLNGPMIVQFKVANVEDVLNIDDYSERVENGEMADMLGDFHGETQEKYSKLVNEIVADLIKYGYIDNQIDTQL